MAVQKVRRIPNAVTKTLLCVNSRENYDYSGVLYNPYLPRPVLFLQIKDILGVLEDFFDAISYPQPCYEPRTFLGGRAGIGSRLANTPELYQELSVFDNRGRLASFVVEVYQRQNASWQGLVRWLETDRQETFSSVLELLRWIDAAIEGEMAR